MEPVKTAFSQAIKASHGDQYILELEPTEMYFKLWIACCPEYVFYFRPTATHQECTCYYAYLEDMEACADVSAEREEWNQQQIFQLVRRVHRIPRGDLVNTMCDYLKDAKTRISLLRGIAGRGFFKKVMTFEEAKAYSRLNPKPRRPPPKIPPPIHKRHNDVHWEADKKRMKRDGVKKVVDTKEKQPKKAKVVETKEKQPKKAKTVKK